MGFVQQGYGHYIEQIGDEPTEILILFNSGEYQEISLANWLGGNPASLLEDNFGISKSMVDQLPKRETGIFGRGGLRADAYTQKIVPEDRRRRCGSLPSWAST